MEYHHNNEYRLPLGRTTNNDLYARVRGNTLYVYAGQEPLGYAIQEKDRRFRAANHRRVHRKRGARDQCRSVNGNRSNNGCRTKPPIAPPRA